MEPLAARPLAARPRGARRLPRRRPRPDMGRWRLGLVVILVVTVPSLVAEEGWHPRAMIDTGLSWIPFAVLVTVGFLAGGAIAASSRSGRGRRRPRPAAAAAAGASCGLAALAALVACDLVRRFAIVHNGLNPGVVHLWLVAGAGAVVLSGLSAAVTSARAWSRAPRLVRSPR